MHKIGLRIVAGYLLLIVTLGVAVWFVVRSARAVSQLSATEQVLTAQRRAAMQVALNLVDAGTRAETATLQYADTQALQHYLKGMEQVDTALNALRAATTDTLQRARLDSLQALAQLKRQATVGLIAALRNENRSGADLKQQIADLRSGKNSVAVGTQVAVPVRERGEAIVIERSKRGFFNRLGDVFKRAKNDTVRVVSAMHEACTDSALACVDISDTLANILTHVEQNLSRPSTADNRLLQQQSDRLRTTGAELSRRMALLIESFSQAQQRTLDRATQNEAHKRRTAALQTSALALTTTLAAILLFIWVWRDMSRANRYRRALEQAKLTAEGLLERREQLLLTISHDIKAPVNTIQGYAALLKPQTDARSEARKEVEAVESAANHLQHLVNALLDYHKLEAGNVAPALAPVRPLQLLQTVATAFRPTAVQKGLTLHIDLNLKPETEVYTDAFRLRQIVENLLSNAVKYTACGTVTLRAEMRQGALAIEVADTGCGLTRYDCQRVFEPFVRAKGCEGQEGTGLGLSITRQLTQLLGGTLTLYSQLGRGSTFTLLFPENHAAASENQTDSENNQTAETKTAKGMSIFENALTTDPPLDADCPQANAPAPNVEAATANAVTAPNVAAPVNRPRNLSSAPTLPANDEATTLIALLDDDALLLNLGVAMLHNVVRKGVSVHAFTTAENLYAWLDAGNRPALLITDVYMPATTGFDVLNRVKNTHGMHQLLVAATTSSSEHTPQYYMDQGFCQLLEKPYNQNSLRSLLAPLGLAQAPLSARTTSPDGGDTPPACPNTAPEVQSPTHRFFAPLLTFAEGDTEAETAILKQFRADCHNYTAALESAVADRNKAQLCRLAHTLLPTHTLLNTEAVEALQQLEKQRDETQWTPSDNAYAQCLAQTLRRLLDLLP